MIRHICNVKPENVAIGRSNELLAQLEIDDLDVILREKGFVGLDTLNDPVEHYDSLPHADRRKAWARAAQDDFETPTERDRHEWNLNEVDP